MKQTKAQLMDSLDTFTRSYIGTALWSSTLDNGDPMDRDYDIENLSKDCLVRMIKDCKDFQEACAGLLDAAHNAIGYDGDGSQSGHDFWLTRNRHGAGFWDRGLGETGNGLTEAAQLYGSADLYVARGKVFHS